MRGPMWPNSVSMPSPWTISPTLDRHHALAPWVARRGKRIDRPRRVAKWRRKGTWTRTQTIPQPKTNPCSDCQLINSVAARTWVQMQESPQTGKTKAGRADYYKNDYYFKANTQRANYRSMFDIFSFYNCL